MKKSIFKTLSFWFIFLSLLISLYVIFILPIFVEGYDDLAHRLLIAFSVFFGTTIIVLVALLIKKPENQDLIQEQRDQLEINSEYKKALNVKIKELRTRFNDAIKIIKKSSLYKNKRDAKYELPWYLVIGDKSEGKTTLLESSGLDFPLNVNFKDEELSEEIRSDNFQWYFAEHSVFVDVPSKYIEQKESKDDPIIWKEFLNIFTRKKWRRPINGIILSVSVDTLLNKNEKEIEQYAKYLRDRFDELSKAFMSSIPIYLIVTKSDKIEGFNEYFASLKDDEKNEILGMTFDHANENIDTNIIKPQLEDLLKRLNSSVLEKIHYEWEPSRKGKIFTFCENFSELFDKTNLFISICFSKTRYRKPLMLRGLYFTSVQSDYNPHALVHHDDLDYARNTKGLFIKKLLNDIIFPESDIIKMDDNYKQKIKKNQYIAYAASVIMVAFISVFLVKDFIHHNDVLTDLEKSYQIYKTQKEKLLPSDNFSTTKEVLDTLDKIVEYEKYHIDNSFWKLLFYKVDERKEKLSQIYYNDLTSLLLPRIEKHIETKMNLELNDFNKTWNNTKAYIMLEDLKRREAIYLKDYMAKNWNTLFPNEAKIQSSLNYHWSNLIEYGFVSRNLNQDALKLTRSKLTRHGPELLTYKGLKNKFSQMNLKSFTFAEVLGSNLSSFNGNNHRIDGFYTKEGYSILIKKGKELISNILVNNWVIGKRTDLNDVEIDEHYEKVLSFYFADYKKHWLTALGKLKIPKQKSIVNLNNQLSILSSADSPIYSVLRALKENTQLYTMAEQLKMKAKQSESKGIIDTLVTGRIGRIITKKAMNNVNNKPIDNNSIKNLRAFFKPYNNLFDKSLQAKNVLKNATEKLNKTYQTMTLIYGAVNPKYDSFNIVNNRVLGKEQPIVVPLNSLPIHVKKWYRSVLQNNWRYLLSNAKMYINIKYREDVLSYYSERLKNKYPIYKNESKNFVKLDDFTDFFKRDGILDKFYKAYVSNFVNINTNSGSYSLKNLDGNAMNIKKSYMNAILKSYRIRKIFFKNDGSLGFASSIKPHDLDSNLATMELSYDDETILYEHGPRQDKKIVWPPQSFNNVVKFNLYDLSNTPVVNNYVDNDWALFKLIDKFSVKKLSNNAVIINYKQKNTVYEGSYYMKGPVTRMFTKYNSLSNFYLGESL